MKAVPVVLLFSLLLAACEKDASIPPVVSAKVKQLIFTSVNSGVTRVDTFSYEYDSLDRLILEKSVLQKSTASYSYPVVGTCIQKNYVGGAEGLNIVYFSNSANKLDSTLVISTDKKDTVSTKWLYSADALVSQVRHYTKNSTLWRTDFFSYDANRNVTAIEEKAPNGSMLQRRTFEVSNDKPYWYNLHQTPMPALFVNTPIKQVTNNNEISMITYVFDGNNRVTKETWNTAANGNMTIKEYFYY